MSATRLLVLGVVRIFQPVHGYSVRRELLSWRAEEWARVNPGSIYNALRTLARDGFLEEGGTEVNGGRPARTAYRVAADGEAEYFTLLRQALWTVEHHDPVLLDVGLCFCWSLERDEVIEAMGARVKQLEATIAHLEHEVRHLEQARTMPAHVAENFRLGVARCRGEADFAEGFAERLRSGYYRFGAEEGAGEPTGPGVSGWPGPLDGSVSTEALDDR